MPAPTIIIMGYVSCIFVSCRAERDVVSAGLLGLGLEKGGSYEVTKARKRREEVLMRLMVSLGWFWGWLFDLLVCVCRKLND